MSREHIISASQFDSKSITIQGLPWCKSPKRVGLASLVANDLCRHHNSMLSPTDREAARFKRALHDFIVPHTEPVHFLLQARAIERWLLKTTINLALANKSAFQVTEDLVRIAFGLVTPPMSTGFFFIGKRGNDLRHRSGTFAFETLNHREDGRFAIAGFSFHGAELLYALPGAPPVEGALRVRALERQQPADRIELVWSPELASDDRVMPARTQA